MSKPAPIPEEIVSEVSRMVASGVENNAIIARMRALGLHKIDCIKLLKSEAGISLHDGKDLVHLSPAWADRYAYDEAFHDACEEAAAIIVAEDRAAA